MRTLQLATPPESLQESLEVEIRLSLASLECLEIHNVLYSASFTASLTMSEIVRSDPAALSRRARWISGSKYTVARFESLRRGSSALHHPPELVTGS
jgi:hypothetical protein